MVSYYFKHNIFIYLVLDFLGKVLLMLFFNSSFIILNLSSVKFFPIATTKTSVQTDFKVESFLYWYSYSGICLLENILTWSSNLPPPDIEPTYSVPVKPVP